MIGNAAGGDQWLLKTGKPLEGVGEDAGCKCRSSMVYERRVGVPGRIRS